MIIMENKLKNRIISALRKINAQSDTRKQVLDEVKERKCVGKYKNGNDKFLNMYRCKSCENQFKSDEIQVDHIEPVIEPSVGFKDWNIYMSRLFCDISLLQVLCKRCHNIKTKRENEKRS